MAQKAKTAVKTALYEYPVKDAFFHGGKAYTPGGDPIRLTRAAAAPLIKAGAIADSPRQVSEQESN